MLLPLVYPLPVNPASHACPAIASQVSNYRGALTGLVVNASDRVLVLRVMNVKLLDRPADWHLDRDILTPIAMEPATLEPHAGKMFSVPPELHPTEYEAVVITFDC